MSQTKACLPVMARPRINARGRMLVHLPDRKQKRKKKASKSKDKKRLGTSRLTMNITLTLVSLNHKEVSHMTPNVVLVASSVTAKDFLEAMQTISIQ